MAEYMDAPVRRRTVAKGIAWSVPAVAVAGTAPAFALSGRGPSLLFDRACKYPGTCIGDVYEKSYGVRFLVTNDTDKDIRMCPGALVVTKWDSAQGEGSTWTPTSDCQTIEKNSSGYFTFRFNNSSSSANLKFEANVSISWGHSDTCTCPIVDPTGHEAIVVPIVVDATLPDVEYCPCRLPK